MAIDTHVYLEAQAATKTTEIYIRKITHFLFFFLFLSHTLSLTHKHIRSAWTLTPSQWPAYDAAFPYSPSSREKRLVHSYPSLMSFLPRFPHHAEPLQWPWESQTRQVACSQTAMKRTQRGTW